MRIICKYIGVEKNIFKEQLRRVGLRATPARIAIMRLLQESSMPLDAAAVQNRLRKKAPDLATTYRVLSSLVEKELVRAVGVKTGVVSYEMANLPHHHHLICEKCGFVEDVETCCESPQPRVASFSMVKDHRLEFSGICNNCA